MSAKEHHFTISPTPRLKTRRSRPRQMQSLPVSRASRRSLTARRQPAPRALLRAVACSSAQEPAVPSRGRGRRPRTTVRDGAGAIDDMYDTALDLVRTGMYDHARAAFSRLTSKHPAFCKAWVSWAQMEKRTARLGQAGGWERCQSILDAGLRQNPKSACLAQAWGLLLLQRGNAWAAVKLLERSVALDPALCSPVLGWKPVTLARAAMASCRGRRVCVAAAVRAAGAAAPPDEGGGGDDDAEHAAAAAAAAVAAAPAAGSASCGC